MSGDTDIEIFRLGRHTDMHGTAVQFGQAEAEAAIAAYDPAVSQAPLVVGHPKLDGPAYGWVTGLSLAGDILAARTEQVDADFAELVNTGRFKTRSASFYPPEHPRNPKPGVFYLKHVGFLGATPPSVKGLKPAQFAADQAEGCVTLEFAQEPPAMTDKTADFAARETALTEREAAFAEKEKTFAAAATKARHDGNVAFAEGLVAAGKLRKGDAGLLTGALDALAGDATVDFGEAGQLTPAAALKKLFDGAKPLVEFGELAKADVEDGDGAISFAAPDGYTADPARLALHGKALALQAANPNLSYLDAVRQAS